MVRRFAVAKLLETHCNQYGGNPTIPASCQKKIPGVNKIKCNKPEVYTSKVMGGWAQENLIYASKRLNNLYVKRHNAILKWNKLRRDTLSRAAISTFEWERIHHNELIAKIDKEMLDLVKGHPLLLAITKNINLITNLMGLML